MGGIWKSGHPQNDIPLVVPGHGPGSYVETIEETIYGFGIFTAAFTVFCIWYISKLNPSCFKRSQKNAPWPVNIAILRGL